MKFGKILASFFKFFFSVPFFLFSPLGSQIRASGRWSPLAGAHVVCSLARCSSASRARGSRAVPPCLSRSRAVGLTSRGPCWVSRRASPAPRMCGLGCDSHAQSRAAPVQSAGASRPALLSGRCPADLCSWGGLHMCFIWGVWPPFWSAVRRRRLGLRPGGLPVALAVLAGAFSVGHLQACLGQGSGVSAWAGGLTTQYAALPGLSTPVRTCCPWRPLRRFPGAEAIRLALG